jgi:hypothetical protein
MVFLPPGDIHSFDQAQLPRMLAKNGVMTVITSPQRDGLYTGDSILSELRAMIDDVVAQHGIPPGRVAVGGFSAGGLGAVRYTEFCLKGGPRTNAASRRVCCRFTSGL